MCLFALSETRWPSDHGLLHPCCHWAETERQVHERPLLVSCPQGNQRVRGLQTRELGGEILAAEILWSKGWGEVMLEIFQQVAVESSPILRNSVSDFWWIRNSEPIAPKDAFSEGLLWPLHFRGMNKFCVTGLGLTFSIAESWFFFFSLNWLKGFKN